MRAVLGRGLFDPIPQRNDWSTGPVLAAKAVFSQNPDQRPIHVIVFLVKTRDEEQCRGHGKC